MPRSGKAFLSVKDSDKPRAVKVAKDLVKLGFTIMATRGTANTIREAGIEVETVNKVAEGRPHIGDVIKNDEIVMVINTVEEKEGTLFSIPASYGHRLWQPVSILLRQLRERKQLFRGSHVLDNINVYDLQSLHRMLH